MPENDSNTPSVQVAPLPDIPLEQRYWLAAAIDFEGSIMLGKNARRDGSARFAWRPCMIVGNLHRGILELMREICGCGNLCQHQSNHRKLMGYRTMHQIYFGHNALRRVLPLIMDYLVIKPKQAMLLLEALDLLAERRQNGNHRHLEDSSLECRLEEIYEEIRELNGGAN